MSITEKSVTLRGGEKVLVQEVSARRVMKALPFLNGTGQNEKEPGQVRPFIETVDELLGSICGLSADKLLDLYPSDWEKLWEAFREVNSFFFKTAEKLGLAEQLGTMLRSILNGVGNQLADSLKADIRTALTTVSAGSSEQSKSQSELEQDA